MITDDEILNMIRAANEGEKIAAQFAGKFMAMWSAGMAVHPGSAAYERYVEISLELDRLCNIVLPEYAYNPTIETFLEANPPEPFGRKPTRMQRCRQYQQIRWAMLRLYNACAKVNDRWRKLCALKGETW